MHYKQVRQNPTQTKKYYLPNRHNTERDSVNSCLWLGITLLITDVSVSCGKEQSTVHKKEKKKNQPDGIQQHLHIHQCLKRYHHKTSADTYIAKQQPKRSSNCCAIAINVKCAETERLYSQDTGLLDILDNVMHLYTDNIITQSLFIKNWHLRLLQGNYYMNQSYMPVVILSV